MIVVDQLTKRYGRELAVDQASFRCEPGTVTGFLGPNGAGKSTTMRMICGLTPPTAGTATIGEMPYRRIGNPGRRVGVLLDASAAHKGRTGRETLGLAAQLLSVPAGRVRELLELVGLAGSAAKKLREVEAVADQLVVIGNGKIIAQGSKDELLAGDGTRVRALDPEALRRALKAADLAFAPTPDGALLVEADPERVGRAAAGDGVILLELRPADDGGLEQMFLTLTTNHKGPSKQREPIK